MAKVRGPEDVAQELAAVRQGRANPVRAALQVAGGVEVVEGAVQADGGVGRLREGADRSCTPV
ncbi:hypothetical protein [Streptomyces sp. NPDC059122]|uniref:hypothetical protein n=1 Tax=Streptomyces sp. NPDC059122 TaxID=3346732 RepID=UPI0036D147A5